MTTKQKAKSKKQKAKRFLITGATIILTCISFQNYAQTNALPTTGNVGIGTTQPDQKLTVRGSARIDSMLVVKDSIIVNKTANLKSDLKVQGNVVMKSDLKVVGESTLVGNTVIKDGNLKIKSLGDSTLAEDGVLMIDENGKVKNGGDLKSLVYLPEMEQVKPCKEDIYGNIQYVAPHWQADPQRMYLINSHCSFDPRLGVGVKPLAKTHIRLVKDSELHPLLIEKTISYNTTLPQNQQAKKLMQLDHTGLLYAREIKVNLDSWPDYVFDENYELMPLDQLKQYIQTNNHLPNVPSACEMEEEGINVAKSNVMLMEKVEELTLYMIQINEQVKAQDELLKQKEETIRLQQELIKKLEQQVNANESH